MVPTESKHWPRYIVAEKQLLPVTGTQVREWTIENSLNERFTKAFGTTAFGLSTAVTS